MQQVGNLVLYNGLIVARRRRHTTFKCDWSSDVCSSDLNLVIYDGSNNPIWATPTPPPPTPIPNITFTASSPAVTTGQPFQLAWDTSIPTGSGGCGASSSNPPHSEWSCSFSPSGSKIIFI